MSALPTWKLKHARIGSELCYYIAGTLYFESFSENSVDSSKSM